MTGLPNRTETSWAAIIAEAYAADTKPPLTAELTGRIRTDLGALDLPGGSLDGARIEAVNGALDAFELALEAVAGPRLATAEAGGAVADGPPLGGRPSVALLRRAVAPRLTGSVGGSPIVAIPMSQH